MTEKHHIVLGIETSCDETAVALVDSRKTILADALISQKEHGLWGGVVPEIAARAHLDALHHMIRRVMGEASLRPAQLDGVAATAGPGLIGGLFIGLSMGKALAMAGNVPFLAVHHLSAHALSARLEKDCPFPYLLLLASGGHCLLAVVQSPRSFLTLGRCLDDAPGETFDKTARLLGLGYPGGVKVERRAKDGDGTRIPLPRPMQGKNHCDFSFSGLKSAVRRMVENPSPDTPSSSFTEDICASLQNAIGDIFIDRLSQALEECARRGIAIQRLVFAGGVAANANLRRRVQDFSNEKQIDLFLPSARLCTDNGAMIAWAALEYIAQATGREEDWDTGAHSRWPLPEAKPAHSS